jgi:hypothetical protein
MLIKLISFLIGIIAVVGAVNRNVTYTLNPMCDKCGQQIDGSYNNLLYVQMVGSDDAVHILYSNIDSLTVLLFRTSLDAKLSVSQDDLLSKNATRMAKSISFSKAPLESAGYSFPFIYEFDDFNFTADMSQIPNNSSYWYVHKTSDLLWNMTQIYANDSALFEGFHPKSNGSFKFMVRFPGKDERDKTLPHLLLKPESTSIDFLMDNLDPKFNHSKFGLNIVFLTDAANNSSMNSIRTLDDEYTPGTFKLWSVRVSDSVNNTVKNYLQWKPIFYFYDPKTLENSTLAKEYDLGKNGSVPLGIGTAFFDASSVKLPALNVSFGIQGDDKEGYFYPQTRFSAWAFTVGLGDSPVDKMSPIVTLVIFIGFGLPGLVIAIGLVVMVVKKCRRNSEFQPL